MWTCVFSADGLRLATGSNDKTVKVYDISRIIQGGETNYVSATLAVYLDVYNVFVGLLQLIMAFTGERD